MTTWLAPSKYADVIVGTARICAGFCYHRGQHGWHLPGRGFTTDKDRAAQVAYETHIAMTPGAAK